MYKGKNPWRLVDLSDLDKVVEELGRLDRLRWHDTASEEEDEAWYNLWGVFEKLDKRNIRL